MWVGWFVSAWVSELLSQFSGKDSGAKKGGGGEARLSSKRALTQQGAWVHGRLGVCVSRLRCVG